MAIPKHELEEMNKLLSKGLTIADIARKYPQYEYGDVYWNVNDYSLRGKKYKITGRLKKLETSGDKAQRVRLVKEVKELVQGIYDQFKVNGKKLNDIGKVLAK